MYSQEERIIMKTSIFVLLILFSIISIGESCLNPCSGVTAATCTSPCFKCGLCSEHCCRKYILNIDEIMLFLEFFKSLKHIFFLISETIFGRDETDRIILPCLSGRNDTNSNDLNVGMYYISLYLFMKI